MNCPNCAAALRDSVSETRHRGQVIVRRRVCKKCGHKVWTEERIGRDKGRPLMLAQVRKALDAIIRRIDGATDV